MKPPKLTDEDVDWCVARITELTKAGMPWVDAAHKATLERTQTIMDRELWHIGAVMDARDRRSEKRRQEDIVERAKLRAEMQARATQAQRPTLKATLGDMMNARKARR